MHPELKAFVDKHGSRESGGLVKIEDDGSLTCCVWNPMAKKMLKTHGIILPCPRFDLFRVKPKPYNATKDFLSHF